MQMTPHYQQKMGRTAMVELEKISLGVPNTAKGGRLAAHTRSPPPFFLKKITFCCCVQYKSYRLNYMI